MFDIFIVALEGIVNLINVFVRAIAGLFFKSSEDYSAVQLIFIFVVFCFELIVWLLLLICQVVICLVQKGSFKNTRWFVRPTFWRPKVTRQVL